MSRLRIAFFVALVAAASGLTIVFVPHSPSALQHLAAGAGPAAVPVFVGAGALLTLAMFPGTVLAAAAGLLFGPALGAVVALLAQTLGGVAAALCARTGARSALERVAGRRLTRVADASASLGAGGVAALRCAPGMPATALHYVLGVSRVRLLPLAAGLLIGAAPRIVAYALIGGALSDPFSGAGLAGLALLGATTLVTLVWALRRRRSLAGGHA